VDKAYSPRDLPCSRKLAGMIGGDVTVKSEPGKGFSDLMVDVFGGRRVTHTVHGRERNLSG
jgi:hypothetical protein